MDRRGKAPPAKRAPPPADPRRAPARPPRSGRRPPVRPGCARPRAPSPAPLRQAACAGPARAAARCTGARPRRGPRRARRARPPSGRCPPPPRRTSTRAASRRVRSRRALAHRRARPRRHRRRSSRERQSATPSTLRVPGRAIRGRVAAMGERTQYAPGTFSWTDLTTTDQDAAKAFYGGLFGWQADDRPVGDGMVYSMMQLDGREVAAISPQPQMLRDTGAPPTWNSYVTVESADAITDRAGELGATVLSPPFDVLDAGRMSVIGDPQGALFMPWEPRENIGAALVNASGALCWNELQSTDLEASTAFYSALFGWTITPFEGSPEPYLVIMNGERSNGGIREA